MSTSLDERAKKVRFAGGEQAKRNVQARLAEQKKRVAEKKAADIKRMREVRDNGLAQRQKEYEDKKREEKKSEDARPLAEGEQEPKEKGSLAGKVVGAFNREILDTAAAAIVLALGKLQDGGTKVQAVATVLEGIGSEQFHDDVTFGFMEGVMEDVLEKLPEALGALSEASALLGGANIADAYKTFREGKFR